MIDEVVCADFDQNNKSQNHSRIQQEYTETVRMKECDLEAGGNENPVQKQVNALVQFPIKLFATASLDFLEGLPGDDGDIDIQRDIDQQKNHEKYYSTSPYACARNLVFTDLHVLSTQSTLAKWFGFSDPHTCSCFSFDRLIIPWRKVLRTIFPLLRAPA